MKKKPTITTAVVVPKLPAKLDKKKQLAAKLYKLQYLLDNGMHVLVNEIDKMSTAYAALLAQCKKGLDEIK